MAEQQVNAAHVENAAAKELIIKQVLQLSPCIVPSHDGHKLLDYPCQHQLCKIIIWCLLILRPSSQSWLSGKKASSLLASLENSTEKAGDSAHTAGLKRGNLNDAPVVCVS